MLNLLQTQLNTTLDLNLQVIQIIKIDTRRISNRRLNVTRYSDVDQQQGLSVAPLHDTLHQVERHQRAWCARRTDGNIRLDQRIFQGRKRAMRRAQRLCQLNSMFMSTIDDHQPLRPIVAEV